MPTLDDLVAGSSNNSKQQLQEALLDLLKGNPDILDTVTKSTTGPDRQASDKSDGATRSGDEEDRQSQISPSVSHPELENSLNRPNYQWQLSDSDDGIDPAWTTATKNMTPRELNRWRRQLFSIYVGHLPYDITKKELVQLFNEVGSVQDVHLQPQGVKGGTHTYGFVRFCTLEECRDAVAVLHGRFLGNRTITVEFACETKERLACDDPDDLPTDKRDKLLRNDYPKLEHYRPMSDAESQEKMVLWKLRCSATRQKSSNTKLPVDGQGGSREEVLMNALQEIVKKVASLPADTLATPSGSEGSPCSPWILKEINGNSSFVPTQQSQPDKPVMKEEAMKCNGTQQHDLAQVMNGSTDNQKDLDRPQTLPLNMKGPAQSPEANVPILSTATDGQSPFRASPSSNSPGITPCSGRNVSANVPNSFSVPDSQSPFQANLSSNSHDITPSGRNFSTGMNFSPSNPEVTPFTGHYASPHTPSPGRHVSPVSPGVTPSPGRDFPISSPDITPSPGRYESPSSTTPSQGQYTSPSSSAPSPGRFKSPGGTAPSQGQYASPSSSAPSQGRYESPSSTTPSQGRFASPGGTAPPQGNYVSSSTSGIAPSARRDDNSEKETNTSDSVSLGSLSPERPAWQHCKFCLAQSPTRGHVSESSLSESSTSSCSHCQGGEERSGDLDNSHVRANLKGDVHNQYVKPSQETVGINGGGTFNRIPNGKHVSGMGLCTFDDDNQYNRQAHGSSRFNQQIGSSPPSSSSWQDKVMNQAGAVSMGASGQHSKSPPSRAVSSNQGHFPRDPLSFGRGRGSQQSHVVAASQISKKEVESRPSVAKLSPVAGHHQQNLTSGKDERSINTGTATSKPLSPNSTTVPGSTLPASSPGQSAAPFAPDAVRPLMQQPLLNDHPQWPRQQVHPLLANLMASRFQQPGFPGHHFGIPPFVAPGVLNPALFQGWDTNALLQQQLLASRLPFRLPFQTGGQKPWARGGQQGLLRHPVRGCRPPAGHFIGSAGRGRPFAPRFRSPGVVNIRTSGDLEKISAAEPLASTPELSSSVKNIIETQLQSDTIESNKSISTDAQNNARELSPVQMSFVERKESASVTSISGGSAVTNLASSSIPPSDSFSMDPSETVQKEATETTGFQGILSSQAPGENDRVSGEGQFLATSPASTLPRQEGDLESTETTKTSLSKLSPSELLLKERKSELKRIVQGNEMLRQCIDWRTSAGAADSRDALKREVHSKEVQLQKEKEIMLARKTEQEILYEREKLEAGFDQQLKKELETEQRIGETENKIQLAQMENELLVLYQSLYGTKEVKDSAVVADS